MSTAAIILTVYIVAGLVYTLILCRFAYKQGARKGLGKLFIVSMAAWPIALGVSVAYYIKSKGGEA